MAAPLDRQTGQRRNDQHGGHQDDRAQRDHVHAQPAGAGLQQDVDVHDKLTGQAQPRGDRQEDGSRCSRSEGGEEQRRQRQHLGHPLGS